MSDAPRAVPDPGVVAGWKLIAAVVAMTCAGWVAFAVGLYQTLIWWEEQKR